MAKMVQDLSQDFIYDDEVKSEQNNKKKLTPKQRNYVIGFSILGVLAIAISIIYAFAANVWLADYKTIGYLTFAYEAQTEEEYKNGVVKEAQVVSIDLNSNYPSTFRIPSQINGHKVTSIADNAFQGATRLKKIIMTDNIVSVGDNAFAGCENLESFKWSKNLNHIGTNAFLNTAYEANWNENSYEVVNNILLNVGTNYFPSNTVLINNEQSLANVPDSYKTPTYTIKYFEEFSSNVTSWMNGLFQNNDSIVYLETPSYLDYIPIDAFSGCSNLEVVDLGEHVTSLNERSFKDCTNLTTINLDNISRIEDEALKNTAINFALDLSNVTYLGNSAFEGCSNLTKVTYSSTLTKVPNSLFKDCSSLNEINFSNFDLIDSFGVSSFENTAFVEFKIPRRIISLNDRLFAECDNLTTIYLYNNTTNTSYNVGTDEDDEEEEIVVEGVVRINAYVFYNCPLFRSIMLYDVNGNIESQCTDDNTIYLPATLVSTSNTNGNNYGYPFYNTSAKKVIFNSQLKTIGNSFFEGNTTLEEVVFEKSSDSNPGYSIESIGEKAFKGTTNLANITIPSTVNIVGSSAFEGSGVSFVKFESASGEDYKTFSALLGNTFNNCPNLNKIELPESISSIAKDAVKNCPNLTSLYIPSNIRTINKGAFTDCGNDTNKLTIYLHKTVEDYKYGYFYDGWCDDTCEFYLFSEEMPTTKPSVENCKGFFHLNGSGEVEVWPDVA